MYQHAAAAAAAAAAALCSIWPLPMARRVYMRRLGWAMPSICVQGNAMRAGQCNACRAMQCMQGNANSTVNDTYKETGAASLYIGAGVPVGSPLPLAVSPSYGIGGYGAGDGCARMCVRARVRLLGSNSRLSANVQLRHWSHCQAAGAQVQAAAGQHPSRRAGRQGMLSCCVYPSWPRHTGWPCRRVHAHAHKAHRHEDAGQL